MTEELWTLEQLPDRVATLLSGNYDGQSNGRVRELPNGRTIRWYTTIGLVDRPATTRGRTAMYGPRHLLQLAAVKRLQAAGHTLAEIQEQLLGATNDQLADLAQVPRMDVTWPEPSTRVEGFWRSATHTQEPGGSDDSVTPTVTNVHGIRIGDSVTVVLDAATRAPDVDELAAIEAAAAPLLDLLGRLGLASTPGKERR
jgi:DNA-binding transcriptional MerR regulator